MNELSEKCGVFGIYGKGMDVSRITFDGLRALQHRGQESSGIAASNGEEIYCVTGKGLVRDVFKESDIRALRGDVAIGHNRYSTCGGSGPEHRQPFVEDGQIALAHNGNLPSVTALTRFLGSKGIDVDGFSDSKLMAMAISWIMKHGQTAEQSVREAFHLFTGAFSITALTKDCLMAFRDECGIRPLSIGTLNGAHVIASETCALTQVGAEFLREVNPGELVVIDSSGLKSYQIVPSLPKIDAFEFVYFARPDSIINDKLVHTVRRNCGKILAREHPIDVDLVVPVPQTSIPAAEGYAWALGLRHETVIVKNRYVDRTFIEPDQHIRELGVKMKLTPMPSVISGKRIAVFDDSIVRGTTSKQLVNALFEAGAKEVHMMVSSPPVRFPDFYGINTPQPSELIAHNRTVEQVRKYIGATSLHYLSLEGLIEAIGLPKENLCTACFTGEYPIDLHERTSEVSG